MDEAELQTEETGEQQTETAPVETPEEKTPEGYIKAEESQRQVNKQHRKYRDEERARKRIEAEAETLRKELAEIKAKAEAVEVPPVPDPYSDDFEQQVKARDEAVKKQAQQEAARSRLEDDAKRKEAEARAKEEEATRAKIAGFDSNMVNLGLNPLEVNQAANALADYGISNALEDVLLEDEEGPLLVQYLAKNPVELEALEGMSALQMLKTLDGEVRQKASLLKPKTSAAPNPPDTLTGGGVKEIEDPLLKGAVFE